jgi:hypothetical protein
VVVWELVTGRKLYDHEDDVATLLSVVTEEPPRLSSVMQGVPSALDEAVAYALSSDVNNRCPSAEALRCMLESAWDECGGMATTAELGAFVRQTVGQRLAERRALVARGRISSAPSSGISGTNPAPALPVADGGGARVPEDGTKTAISAAVPAADRLDAPRVHRLSRRSMGVAALLSLSVVAAVMGVAVRNPEEQSSGAASQNAEGSAAEGQRAVEGARLETNGWASDEPENVLADPAEASVAQAASEAVIEPPLLDSPLLPQPTADIPTSRRTSARQKGSGARSKSKNAARSGASGSRSSKPVAVSTRVLPIPQPSERQLRNKKPTRPPLTSGPAPLNLAPDPYDSNR